MQANCVRRFLYAAAIASSLLLHPSGVAATVQGKVKVEVYRNIPGTTIGNLRNAPAFPSSPSAVYYVNSLEFPDADNFPAPGNPTFPQDDVWNNYGIRVTGFITPDKTANYAFYLSSDDNGEFWLSPDENPANAVLIATENEWNPIRNFVGNERRTCVLDPTFFLDKCNNVSSPIRLEAGKRYAFVGFMKEGGGGDNFAVAWTEDWPGFPMEPISGQFLSTTAPDAPQIVGQPRSAAALSGAAVTFSVGLDIPPGVTVNSIEWQKNGVAIPNSNSAELTFVAQNSDADAKIKAVVNTSAGTLTSAEATLTVGVITSEFTAGIVKMERWNGIGGGSVGSLTSNQRYIDGQADVVQVLGSVDAPANIGNDYGVRISGFIVPQSSGSFRFFVRSDDGSQLFLSPDSNPANAVPVAEEPNCCRPFEEPGDNVLETSFPINLVQGQRYAFYYLMKEGGGDDFGQVAVRKEGDTTAAAQLKPLSGPWIGANFRIANAVAAITKQPTSVTLDEGRTLTLEVNATTSPSEFNLPLIVQWQKNGTDIAGANSTTLVIPNAAIADSGTYRAVVSAAGVNPVTSAEATVTVQVDTSGPLLVSGGAVQKGANVELGLVFDEAVDATLAGQASSFTVSKGTIQSARFISQSGSTVLVVSGLAAGDKVTVTATNLKDVKGNVRASTSTEITVPANIMSWVGVGGNELNRDFNTTRFSDDVVARSQTDFDLISGGSGHWVNYDEQTFVYQEITGDFDKVVRVEYQDPVTQWSRTGLDAREALDEGKTRADIEAGYKFSQHLTVRVNPPAVPTWDGRAGNNNHEVIHRPVEGKNYDGFNAMFNIRDGGGGAPPYPNAWLRLKREGQKLSAFRSSDGVNWIGIGHVTYQDDPESPENELLADKLYVGMFYAPEFYNIPEGEPRSSRASSIAKFRNYGDFTVGPVDPPSMSISREGNQITISWTNGGVLEASSQVDGGWETVQNGGTSPFTTTASEAARFYRVRRN